MKKMFEPRGLRVLTWIFSIVLLAAASSAAPRTPIADFAASGAQAVWTPSSDDYDHLVVTVSGPGGSQVRRESPAGVYPSFDLFDEAGSALPDGLYKWELTLVPRVDAAMRARLAEARGDGQNGLEGSVAGERSRQSGFFSIADGAFVSTDVEEPAPAALGGDEARASIPGDPQGLVLSISDGVIRNSLCVGGDCPNSPAFSDSTILMMENNTRIKFGDTSSASSFPRNDWEIEANSSVNGGANYLGFNDCGTADNDGGCTTDLVFAVEAGARSSALYVESDGDVGIGTSNPVVELHVVRGDTPTLRLEQDGSSGFTPQTWDVAGNETSFFVRDVTNGSTLPFRIFPGASSQALVIDDDNDIGIGAGTNPDAALHVQRSDGTAQIHVEDSSAGNQQMMLLEKTTNAPFIRFTSQFGDWDFLAGNTFIITDPSTGNNELSLSRTGDLTINGQCSEAGSGTCADYVFEPGYELLSLGELQAFIDENQHLPNVPSTEEIQRDGLNVQNFQGRLLEKVEELTLYTLEQQSVIDALTARLEALETGSEGQ